MTPLKVWLHTALGSNHQLFACRSYSLYVWLLWYPNYYPGVRDEDSGQPWDNDQASLSNVLLRSRTQASRVKGKSLTARPPLYLWFGSFEGVRWQGDGLIHGCFRSTRSLAANVSVRWRSARSNRSSFLSGMNQSPSTSYVLLKSFATVPMTRFVRRSTSIPTSPRRKVMDCHGLSTPWHIFRVSVKKMSQMYNLIFIPKDISSYMRMDSPQKLWENARGGTPGRPRVLRSIHGLFIV